MVLTCLSAGTAMTHTFSRFVYCDTNILSFLARRQEAWPRLARRLIVNDLTLAIGPQVAELADASQLHRALSAMFVAIPAAIIKTADLVFEEELRAYPHFRTDSLLSYPLNALLYEPDGLEQVAHYLASEPLRDVRRAQQASSRLMLSRHAELRANFPPAKSGRYERHQTEMFSFCHLVQYLAVKDAELLKSVSQDLASFEPSRFRSYRLLSLVLFYKYYLGNRDPVKLSDFADLFSLYALPYCEVVLMEKDLANTLAQIKRADPILANTVVGDIDTARKWIE